MNASNGRRQPGDEIPYFDAIIVGAGVSGLYMLYSLRERLGMSVKLLEQADGVGGTWYWNAYPGARFDSESWSYGYSFSKELLDEWEWKENFAGQPEIERYLNHVADRFDLRRDIELGTQVTSAAFDDKSGTWLVGTPSGPRARARFLILAVGLLSVPFEPDLRGLDQFKGEWHHTGKWPRDQAVTFAGKRVGVIGTGSTGIQVITEAAKEAERLFVFQRSPGYASPLRNTPISADELAFIRGSYAEIFEQCRNSPLGFIHRPDPRSTLEVPEEERLARWEELWREPGFAKWLANFRDVLTDPDANAGYSEFIREKIRERVADPRVAEMLVPKDHGFGMKRPPMESGYYEVFNQPNVELVDVRSAPIERVSESGVVTADGEYELDLLILATGFDMMTGALFQIDIKGVGGAKLKDLWSAGPRTYLGLQSTGFPNMFLLLGGARANVPRASEISVEWITDCLRWMASEGHERISPTTAAEQEWTDLASTAARASLGRDVDSYLWGSNIPGKPRAFYSGYAGGLDEFRRILERVAANAYEGFVLESAGHASAEAVKTPDRV